MRTLFIGGTKRGYLTLKALLEARAKVVGVLSLSQDEHEMDRYERPIRELAQAYGVPVKEARFVRDAALAGWAIDELKAEAGLGVGVRVLLPDWFYNAFPKGCWGVHDSLLPEYRGFAPLNWAIINDEPKTGVTVFRIAPRMDGGEILLQRDVPIGRTEPAPEVYVKVCRATEEVVLESYELLRTGAAAPQPQDYAAGSFACSRNPCDGLIEWTKPTREIFNLVRALIFPYPGAFTYYRGSRLFVLRAEEVLDAPRYVGRIPGRVVQTTSGGVDVLTGDGLLRIHEVSVDGATTQPAAEVIRSVRAKLGLDVSELVERLAALEGRLQDVEAHELA